MSKKITELPAAAALTDADVAVVVQGTTTKTTARTVLSALATYVLGKLGWATQVQAETATATNVVMSPARVREFCESRGFGGNYTTAKTDLNLATTGGFFSWDNTTLRTPVPSSFGRGMTLPSGPGYLTQVAIVNGTNKMYIRYQNGTLSTDWSAWVLVAQPIT